MSLALAQVRQMWVWFSGYARRQCRPISDDSKTTRTVLSLFLCEPNQMRTQAYTKQTLYSWQPYSLSAESVGYQLYCVSSAYRPLARRVGLLSQFVCRRVIKLKTDTRDYIQQVDLLMLRPPLHPSVCTRPTVVLFVQTTIWQCAFPTACCKSQASSRCVAEQSNNKQSQSHTRQLSPVSHSQTLLTLPDQAYCQGCRGDGISIPMPTR